MNTFRAQIVLDVVVYSATGERGFLIEKTEMTGGRDHFDFCLCSFLVRPVADEIKIISP